MLLQSRFSYRNGVPDIDWTELRPVAIRFEIVITIPPVCQVLFLLLHGYDL